MWLLGRENQIPDTIVSVRSAVVDAHVTIGELQQEREAGKKGGEL